MNTQIALGTVMAQVREIAVQHTRSLVQGWDSQEDFAARRCFGQISKDQLQFLRGEKEGEDASGREKTLADGTNQIVKVLSIMLVSLNFFLRVMGATETGKWQDHFVVQRDFSDNNLQFRRDGNESRELGL